MGALSSPITQRSELPTKKTAGRLLWSLPVCLHSPCFVGTSCRSSLALPPFVRYKVPTAYAGKRAVVPTMAPKRYWKSTRLSSRAPCLRPSGKTVAASLLPDSLKQEQIMQTLQNRKGISANMTKNRLFRFHPASNGRKTKNQSMIIDECGERRYNIVELLYHFARNAPFHGIGLLR